ncbi:MAG: Nif3-like dinuclear metal center hexameric protein [Bacteroidia bacterium]|nr:Nif3-like dinuclear metal center hexameric protein [Bacteroidia bacterium]
MAVYIQDIADALEAWAPIPLAETYDNVGLLVGSPTREVSRVLLTLDVTEAVVAEAADMGCNLIIAHHPIWFTPRKRLTDDSYVSRTIMAAIRADIALYAAHTNLDNVHTGVNARIATRLGLTSPSILRSAPGSDGTTGAGMIGWLPESLPADTFLNLVKTTFGCQGIRYAPGTSGMIHQVAVCGGAGSFLIPDALRRGADAFVTADITYHKFFDAEGQMLLMDIGHYESEQFTGELILSYLSEKFPNFALHLSSIYTNPVRYWA